MLMCMFMLGLAWFAFWHDAYGLFCIALILGMVFEHTRYYTRYTSLNCGIKVLFIGFILMIINMHPEVHL